jgi:hypothetical protein
VQKPIVEFKKSYFFGLFAILLWAPLPWLYFNPPQFLQGQPLAVYAIVLFLAGISSAALAVFFLLKRRMSSTAARIYSILFLLVGIGAYQLSGYAPSWSCFGKRIYAATANAAGQTCRTTCTDNDKKPCDGWSDCWDKFVSCSAAGKDQDGRNCSGCCFDCAVVCEPDPEPEPQPPTISGSISCSQPGANGWCIGTEVLTLTASDPQNYTLTISGDIGGTPFTCPVGNACFQPIPQGSGTINYLVTAAQSGLPSAPGSTTWALDATPPSINGTLTGTAGANGWYLGPVTYNGAASDGLSGLASLTCTLDGAPLGSCNSITVSNEGVHTLAFIARDNAGNTQAFNQTISIDLQNPTLNSGIVGTLGSNNWYNDATLNASASDAAPGSGLWRLEYSLDGGSWTGFPASGSLSLPEGQHTVDVRAVDFAGRVTTGTKSYALDRELPSIAITPAGTFGLNNWYITPLTVSASASDSTSGMDVFEYSLNKGAWTTYSSALTLNDGMHSLSFWAQDLAGLVKQVDETYQVDTRAPQISGNLSGVPGANDWYISQVTVSASAADPLPGSGVETLTYVWNSGTETPYANPLTLSEGQHTIQFNTRDIAGLTDSKTQTIKVDTTKPSLNITTTLPAWSMDTITINGTASDSGSGLSKVELSLDGSTWQAVTGTTAWSYDWDTTKGRSDSYQVRVRATDHAGLTTEQLLNVGVDNTGPKIHLPEEWFQWDTVTLDVWDNHSGLSEVRVEISDPEGRWKTRKIKLDPNEFPLDFKWDRRFGDGTVAPLGKYPVKVMAFDNMGHMTRVGGTAKILLGILPAGPTATPQPYMRLDPTLTSPSLLSPFTTPTVTAMPFISGFGSTPEPTVQATPTIAASPRATPTKTTIMDWIESIFVPNTIEETVTEVSTPEADPNIFWGATLAAVAGAAAAYNLAEQRKREEAAARKKANEEERRVKLKKQKLKKLEAQWDQEEAWEAARLEAARQEKREAYDADMKNKLDRVEAEDQAKWDALQVAIQKREEEKKLEKQYTGLESYRNSEWHGEKAAPKPEPNWWEKTKSFVNENIIQPANTHLYEPYVEPAVDKRNEILENVASWANENINERYLQPAWDKTKEFVNNEMAWMDENINQPYIQPALEKTKQFIKNEIETINENVYQPYIKPHLDAEIQKAKKAIEVINEKVVQPYIVPAVTTLNEKVYQPYVKPLVDKTAQVLTNYTQWVDEKLYQPVFAPVVNDINKYIYQPLVEKASDAWEKYGEWVHGALDTVGFIPGLGEIADGLNGVIYLAEGHHIEAGVSLLAMIPLVGDLGKAGKWTVKIGQEIVEEVVEKVVKEGAEELIEKAIKETVEEVSEKIVKEAGEELAEKIGKEALEEAAEKTVKKAGETLVTASVKDVVGKTTKEATNEVVAKVASNTVSVTPKVLAKDVSESIVKETVKETVELVNKETVQHVLKEAVEGKVTKLPADVAQGLTKDGANELASKISAELGGKKVWVSAQTGSIYISKPPEEGFALAKKLAQTDLTNKEEVRKILREIAELTSRGSGNHVVLGPFGAKGDFIQEALDTDGIFWDVGDELWKAIEDTGIDMFELNDQFIQVQISKSVNRFDVIKTDVDEVINSFNNEPPKDWKRIKYTQKEVLSLASLPDIPYQLVDNSWVRLDLIKRME